MKISRYTLLLLCLFSITSLSAQVAKDLAKSVPAWLDYQADSQEATLRWINDDAATAYKISGIEYEPNPTLSLLTSLDGTTNEWPIDTLQLGKTYHWYISKTIPGSGNGVGIISAGLEIPAIHQRGRCLLAIEDSLALPLQVEIDQLRQDLSMDGWTVDTLHVSQNDSVVGVKNQIVDWYDSDYELAQSLFILGHLPVPYSGNSAHDGHNNHQGAWVADVFYGDVDGNWTDVSVNNTTPSREVNKNIPGDGKYDQTTIPGQVEIEIGRVDFANLPAFPIDEVELTRKYLQKNHAFRTGQKAIPRRAIIENNFASFNEGFGQSGWRSFTPMFGAANVQSGDYNTTLDTAAYLCSYACGGGSYTSASGIGSTQNLWVAKEIKTVFTLNFGSYFGDWDSNNNFLRAALGSGDVLVNAWAGRPTWHLFPMALGQHIGYCARFTQNASSGLYGQGFGSHAAHVSLLGDPTLRLHPVKPASELRVEFVDGNAELHWTASPEAEEGYFVYRRLNGGDWEILAAFHPTTSFQDFCLPPNNAYEYQVKAIVLEQTGSGSYFNTSLGIASPVLQVAENPALQSFFVDADGDGYGNVATDSIACLAPAGYVANADDCDDTDADINPAAPDIPDNGIDENCDGQDQVTSVREIGNTSVRIYPNPVSDRLWVESSITKQLTYRLYAANGQLLQAGQLEQGIDMSAYPGGLYTLELIEEQSKQRIFEKIMRH